MNLKKNNWHYDLWRFNFSEGYKEPTNNFCDYFWAVMLSIVLFPLTLPMFIIYKISKSKYKYGYNIIINLIGSGIIYVAILVGYMIGYQLAALNIAVWICVIGLSLIGLISYLIRNDKFNFTLPTKRGNDVLDSVNNTFSFFKEGFLSFKNKYCPKITWED
jgi:hypothetical protein